jgi:hypothetical protein
MRAQKNGTDWVPGFVKAVLSGIDSLNISASSINYKSAQYDKVDTLYINMPYHKTTGTYQLKANQVFYGVFNNSALTGYQLDASYNNVINIAGFQTMSDTGSSLPDEAKITGTFSLKFVDPNNPSGITFQNGTFYAIIPY